MYTALVNETERLFYFFVVVSTEYIWGTPLEKIPNQIIYFHSIYFEIIKYDIRTIALKVMYHATTISVLLQKELFGLSSF